MAYFCVQLRADESYFTLSVLHMWAISGTSGSSGFGSVSSEHMESKTWKNHSNKKGKSEWGIKLWAFGYSKRNKLIAILSKLEKKKKTRLWLKAPVLVSTRSSIYRQLKRVIAMMWAFKYITLDIVSAGLHCSLSMSKHIFPLLFMFGWKTLVLKATCKQFYAAEHQTFFLVRFLFLSQV